MQTTERADVESTVIACHARGDHTAAAAALLQGYGSELFSFLCAMLRNEDEASDAYQRFCEEMWKALPRFEQRSSVRTWAYALARHSAYRTIRDPRRRRERNVPLSAAPEVQAVAAQVRTTTLLHLRSEIKDRVAQIQEQLAEDERALLLLRVNRQMSWADIARVMAETDGDEGPLDEATLRKRAAMLRQRFKRAKERLKVLVDQDTQIPRPVETN